MQTQAVENYIKTIYKIEREQGRVTTNALADQLGFAPASVTGMIKKLASMKLVTHKPYHGVALTADGRQIALEVIRHHRLVELYLLKALDVPWDQVHAEAERWEHVISKDIEERIDALLGHPTTDPHGAPIPGRDGTMLERPATCLADAEPGREAVVTEVDDDDADFLRYVAAMGIFPGVNIKVLEKAPFDGPLTVRVGQTQHALGRNAAGLIWVSEAAMAEDR